MTPARRPLQAFPQIRTRDVDELVASVRKYYGPISFGLPRGAKGFSVVANHLQLTELGLTYGAHGAAVDIELPTFDFFAQLFSFKGTAQAGAHRASVTIDHQQSFVASAGDTIRLNYAENFEQIVLKVRAAGLIRKLEALTNAPLSGRLRFEEASSAQQPGNAWLQNTFRFLLDQADSGHPQISTLALTEYEQAVMVAFLCGNQHNYSHLLSGRPSDAAPWQVHRAEQYIEQHWDQPLTVEALTVITGVSARSIFHSFKRSRGYSPMEFVRNVRLRRANEMLSKPAPATSVTEVAFDCGFGNLGHFAHYYRRRFGESPSETLARAKHGLQRQ